ncbi:MAG: chromate resistance protein [Litoreibacter sp.]|nr:chromate resistance protein [Litoreibacter sp.]
MPGFNEISASQLMRLIGTPDAPVMLDVCLDEDFQSDPYLIPTARRCPFDQVGTLVSDLKDKRTVLICQKGKKLSHGAAAMLRAKGLAAEVLEGGNVAWSEQGFARIPYTKIPHRALWVTRHRPKIDRIACPWLIRRFVSRDADFLFVPPSEVALVAEKTGATSFDMPGGPWSHQGAQCSFDAMIEGFGLDIPALHKLATVVRAADTNCHDLAPEAAGLLALSVGLSRLHRDDNTQLEAGMMLYDALYRWARDGQDEGHQE